MPRAFNPDLIVRWKVPLSATVAGRVEYMLLHPIHQKPIYGARGELLEKLLEFWIARESGTPPEKLPHIPSVEELRAKAA